MPALPPFHGPVRAWIGEWSFITCNNLAYLLNLLTIGIEDGVVVVGRKSEVLHRRRYKRWYRSIRTSSSSFQHLKHISHTHVQLSHPSLLLISSKTCLNIHHVYGNTLLSVSAYGLAAGQCSWQAAAIPNNCKTQPQLVVLQPILGVAAGTPRERFDIWCGTLLQRFEPIRRE